MPQNTSKANPIPSIVMTILALISVVLAPTLALASAVPQGWSSHGRSFPSEPIGTEVSPTTHPIRMSFTKVEVEGRVVRLRVRAFWDDLQLGIAEHTSNLEYHLAETPESDALVEDYLNEMIQIRVTGEPLAGRIESRGVEPGGSPLETMWWFELVYDTGAPRPLPEDQTPAPVQLVRGSAEHRTRGPPGLGEGTRLLLLVGRRGIRDRARIGSPTAPYLDPPGSIFQKAIPPAC